MNKRIYELAKVATLAVTKPDGHYIVQAWQAKFAELIVEECMWKIMLRKEEAIDNDWHVDEAMSAAISDISEQFGVKQ
jgi:hypothetical protein